MSKRTCTFVADDGTLCGKPHSGRGLCDSHRMQVRRGKPLTPLGRTALTTEQRFWQKVNRNGPINPKAGTACWWWTGATDDKDYGKFWDGEKQVLAHRFAWELFVGPIPDGGVVDHDDPGIGCGRSLCVNPAHVKPVPKGTNNHNGRGLRTDNTSGHQNIVWKSAKWCVQINKDGKKYYGGYFASLDDAIVARDALEARLYGDAA